MHKNAKRPCCLGSYTLRNDNLEEKWKKKGISRKSSRLERGEILPKQLDRIGISFENY